MESKFDNLLKTNKKTPLDIIKGFNVLKFNTNKNLTFESSFYENGTPGSGRTKNRIIKNKSTLEEVKTLVNDLNKVEYKKYELAFHSKIIINNELYHIPLIDFAINTSISKNTLRKFLINLQDKFNHDIYIFKTGHSFHGYVDALLNTDEWKHFLGSLLLLNSPGLSNIIDARWVAHSLENDFSALRISNNTNYYLTYPLFDFYQPKIVKSLDKKLINPNFLSRDENEILRLTPRSKKRQSKASIKKGLTSH